MEPPAKKLDVENPTEVKESDLNKAQNQQNIENILTYDVLRIIFKFLGAKDLFTVTQICRSWREPASKEISIRRAPEYVLKNFKVTDVKDSENSFDATLIGNELRTRPGVGFICTKVQEENEWKAKGCYCENLPSKCSAVNMGGYDIVADDAKVGNNYGMAVCAFIPKIPKLNNKIYYVDRKTFKETNESKNTLAEKMVKEMLPSKNETSKTIIILSNQEGYDFTKAIMKNLKQKYKPGTLSLWGGVCVDLKLCKPSESESCSQPVQWAAVTLSSPLLQSWSVVLLRSNRTEAQIEMKLSNLKKSVQLKKHSMGFMFACCERIDIKELEVKVFKRIFPTVPLIGLHGDGEYGLNTLNTKRDDQLQHAYSTIFMILTYQ